MEVDDVEELNPQDFIETMDNESDPGTEAVQAVDTLVNESLSESVTPKRYLQILHELATFIENLELEYVEKSGNRYGPFDEDIRDDFRIGLVLNFLNNHEIFLDSILGRLVGTEKNTTPEQFNILAGTYRLLIACSVGPNSSAVQIASENSVVDVLLSLVKSSIPPVRCYAVGLLSISLLERKVADRVVRQQIPQLFLERLVNSKVAEHGYFPRIFSTKSTTPTTSSSKKAMELDLLFDNLGEAVSSVSIAKLLLLESKWTLQCLASMGEYQETLASATHTGALDTVLHILKSDHDCMLLDTVELVSIFWNISLLHVGVTSHLFLCLYSFSDMAPASSQKFCSCICSWWWCTNIVIISKTRATKSPTSWVYYSLFFWTCQFILRYGTHLSLGSKCYQIHD
jgi:hypothetical protein